jgi:hypothetical protein
VKYGGTMNTTIELRVDKIGQLFETFDPMPFRERDLDRNAEEYIVGSERDLPRKGKIRILVHVPADEAAHEDVHAIGAAFARHFRYRADVTAASVRELLRTGWYSLGVGMLVLSSCVTAAQLLPPFLDERHLGALVREGLIILGWVANWRPIEIFLYDWWPIVRRRNLYARLAGADVEIAPRQARIQARA